MDTPASHKARQHGSPILPQTSSLAYVTAIQIHYYISKPAAKRMASWLRQQASRGFEAVSLMVNNFGFIFGTERGEFNSFSIRSVSAKSRRTNFSKLSVLLAVNQIFGGH